MAITINGNGTITGVTSGAGNLVKSTLIYNSATEVSSSSTTATQLSSYDFFFNTDLVASGTFTKDFDSSTTQIIVGGTFNSRCTDNSHSLVMWVGTSTNPSGGLIHLLDDQYAMSGVQYGRQKACHRVDGAFTGLGTGSHTFYIAAGRGDSGAMRGTINTNPGSSHTDCSNFTTRSQIWAWEVRI